MSHCCQIISYCQRRRIGARYVVEKELSRLIKSLWTLKIIFKDKIILRGIYWQEVFKVG